MRKYQNRTPYSRIKGGRWSRTAFSGRASSRPQVNRIVAKSMRLASDEISPIIASNGETGRVWRCLKITQAYVDPIMAMLISARRNEKDTEIKGPSGVLVRERRSSQNQGVFLDSDRSTYRRSEVAQKRHRGNGRMGNIRASSRARRHVPLHGETADAISHRVI